ncbi:MAG TPA: M1 family aminopeptidase [Armatimonadota bacterium]|jgi:hypothetical protein
MRKLLSAAALACVSLSTQAAPYDAVLRTVANAATASQPEPARRLLAPGTQDAFDWIPDRKAGALRRVFQPEPWKAAALPASLSNAGVPLAVFHTWHASESDGDHIHALVKSPGGWRIGRETPETDTQGYRIVHHDLRLRILPSAKRVEATDVFTVRRLAKAQPVAYVRISDDFTVSSLRASGKPVAWKQAGGVLAVRVPAGRHVSLEMAFAGVVDHKLMSGFTSDVAALTSYFYPSLGRLPATADTTVRVPAGWTALTQGELISKRAGGTETEFRYRNVVPVNYFSVLAGRYTETKRKAGKVTLYTYLTKSQPGFSESLLDALAMAMPYFIGRFGPYPYTRYSIVDGGSVLGFIALEGYSMASYGTLTLTPMVVSHELSHTWWGGVVPNTYLHSWWNEAFASFSDDSFSRMKNHVPGAHPTDKPWWPSTRSIEAAPLSTARDLESVSTIAYGKGMVILRLLEEQIGQPTFDRCLQTFVRDNKGAADPDWPDLEHAVEKVTGKDWRWFFAQWWQRAGWPMLRLDGVKAVKAAAGWRVTGRIVQDGEAYKLNVRLRVQDAAGSHDTLVPTSTPSVPFTLSCTGEPDKLELEPAFDIPREFGGDDVAAFANGRTTLKHSREEPAASPFGAM